MELPIEELAKLALEPPWWSQSRRTEAHGTYAQWYNPSHLTRFCERVSQSEWDVKTAHSLAQKMVQALRSASTHTDIAACCTAIDSLASDHPAVLAAQADFLIAFCCARLELLHDAVTDRAAQLEYVVLHILEHCFACVDAPRIRSAARVPAAVARFCGHEVLSGCALQLLRRLAASPIAATAKSTYSSTDTEESEPTAASYVCALADLITAAGPTNNLHELRISAARGLHKLRCARDHGAEVARTIARFDSARHSAVINSLRAAIAVEDEARHAELGHSSSGSGGPQLATPSAIHLHTHSRACAASGETPCAAPAEMLVAWLETLGLAQEASPATGATLK